MEKFEIPAVELTTNNKKSNFDPELEYTLPRKGIIRATYKVDDIDYTTRVAAYRYEYRPRKTYFTLYEESGIDPLEVEAFLLDLIMKAQLRDIEDYHNRRQSFRHSLSWLISSIWDNRRWVKRQAESRVVGNV